MAHRHAGFAARRRATTRIAQPPPTNAHRIESGMPQPIYVIASGDLRLDANHKCWPAQQQVEAAVTAAVEKLGPRLVRAQPYDPVKQHGFMDSQRYGMQVFTRSRPDAPLMVIEAVCQYSHHVHAGLLAHR